MSHAKPATTRPGGLRRAALAVLVLLAAFARAESGIPNDARWGATLALGEGRAGQSHDTYRVSVQRHWARRVWEREHFYFSGFWDVGVTLWDASNITPGNADRGAERLWVLGASPVLRWQFQRLFAAPIEPFLELGVGLSLLSDRELRSGNNRALRLGTRWQFEDRAAIGIRFGRDGAWELAYRIMHHSNLDAADENAGVDSHLLSLSRR
ncbi:MAG: acyloxyacyl hydrolase, partial [Pseudomonadota bacterium]